MTNQIARQFTPTMLARVSREPVLQLVQSSCQCSCYQHIARLEAISVQLAREIDRLQHERGREGQAAA